MSAWHVHGSADNSLPNWPLFDEMVWEEFDESGYDSLPEIQAVTKEEWLANTRVSSAAATFTKEETLLNLNAIPDSHHKPDDLGVMSTDKAANTSAHRNGQGSSFIDYSWENTSLEDVDDLFLDNNILLSQALDESQDGILLELASPVIDGNVKSTFQPIKSPSTPSIQAFALGSMKVGVANAIHSYQEVENDLVESSSMSCMEQEYSPLRSLNEEDRISAKASCLNEIDLLGQHLMRDGKKANKLRKHSASCIRRVDDKSRKQANTSQPSSIDCKKPRMMPSLCLPSTFPMFLPPISQITSTPMCGFASNIPSILPAPYVNRTSGFLVHHMPTSVQVCTGHPGYQPSTLSLHQTVGENMRGTQPPTGNSTMTPQEKIEKLRWRQKLQAQLAVERQQYQLIKEHKMPKENTMRGSQSMHLNEATDAALGHVTSQLIKAQGWKDGPIFELGRREEEDESLAANVLQQLLNVTVEMDDRFRLCLRDGFHRLAKSAMRRQASSDIRTNGAARHANESSIDVSAQGRTLSVFDIVETETNPLDRFIAHLLFYKQHSSAAEETILASSGAHNDTQEILSQQESCTLHDNVVTAEHSITLPEVQEPKCFSGFDGIDCEVDEEGMCHMDASGKYMSLPSKVLATKLPSGGGEARQEMKLGGAEEYHLEFMNTSPFKSSLVDFKTEECNKQSMYSLSLDFECNKSEVN